MVHASLVTTRLRMAFRAVGVVALLGGALALAPPASAVIPPSLEDEGGEVAVDAVLPFDRTVTATPAAPAAWRGTQATGHNISFDPGEPEHVRQDRRELLRHHARNVVPGNFYDTAAGGVEFSTGGAAPGTDLDLYVYESDAAGNVGDFVGASGGATDLERVGVIGATGYYLVVVVYFNATNTDYAGRAEFFRRNKFPADVDNPRGLQDTWSVTRPRVPVALRAAPLAGPDERERARRRLEDVQPRSRLAGRVRVQDRHLRVIRPRPPLVRPRAAEHLPAEPGAAVVVAAEQHLLSGRRSGPRRHRARGRGRPRPDGDFGEEYITSDVWTDFDDEGNAYAMVLDSPPFPSGNGWGMSFHRWQTPSAADIRRGRTWSNRIIIDAHPTEPRSVHDARRQEHVRRQQRRSRPRRQDRHHGRLLGPELRAGPGRPPGRGLRALDRRRPHVAGHAAADLAAAARGTAVRAVRDRRARRRLRA